MAAAAAEKLSRVTRVKSFFLADGESATGFSCQIKVEKEGVEMICGKVVKCQPDTANKGAPARDRHLTLFHSNVAKDLPKLGWRKSLEFYRIL